MQDGIDLATSNPDTCQFLSRGENVRAQKRAAFAAYKGYTDLDVIENERKQSNQGVLVVWDGVETPLKSICHRYGKEYEVVRDRLGSWSGSTIYGKVIYDENPMFHLSLLEPEGLYISLEIRMNW